MYFNAINSVSFSAEKNFAYCNILNFSALYYNAIYSILLGNLIMVAPLTPHSPHIPPELLESPTFSGLSSYFFFGGGESITKYII